MRRRLYFVLPDVESARKVHNELLLARVEERHMHVMARDGTDLSGLPEAGLLQRSDVVHGTQLGFTIGGAVGIGLGIIASTLVFAGTGVGGLIVLWMALAGAIIGAWSSSMIAVNVPNTRLQAFESEIADGQVLYMVDVRSNQTDEVSSLIRRYHPEADSHGVEHTIPAFP